MTESEWDTCTNPDTMIAWLLSPVGTMADGMGGFVHGYRLSKRKLCLLESFLHDLVGNVVESHRCRSLAKQLEEGLVERPPGRINRLLETACRVSSGYRRTACDVIRDIAGYPHRPYTLPNWLGKPCMTAETQSLAIGAYQSFDAGKMRLNSTVVSVLADAVEDTGMTHLKERCPVCRGLGSLSFPSGISDQSLRCFACNGDREICIESPLLLHLRNQEWHVPGYWAIDVLMHRE